MKKKLIIGILIILIIVVIILTVISTMISKKEKIMECNYSLYFYDIDDVEYEYNGEMLQLKESLRKGTISIEEVIRQAEEDVRKGKIRSVRLMDGGSKLYEYETFSILKMFSADGNRDIYIGKANMEIPKNK